MEGYDLDKKADRVFALRDIIHDPLPKNFQLGDNVRFIPVFKSQKTLEGKICFIDGERIFFYSGIMPEEFYGTEMAKQPGLNFNHNGEFYTWQLMIHHIDNLEKI
jgi:hypothetical protein